MKRLIQVSVLIIAGTLLLAACGGQQAQEVASEPTATLLPILSETPRFTATPVSSQTPLPTFTYTPSETPIPPTPTLSLTPSPTPPIEGIIQSQQRVNVREGPSTTYSAFESLPAGWGVLILGKNTGGNWYNIRFESENGGQAEGWVSSTLVYVRPTATPQATATPSPDATLLFLGTPLPTVLLGEGTITPTPPGSIRTGTPGSESTAEVSVPVATAESFIPVIDLDTINLTATALAFGLDTPTPRPSLAVSPTTNVLQVTVPTQSGSTGAATATIDPSRTVQLGGTVTAAPAATQPAVITPPPASGNAIVQENARVFALCDNPNLNGSPPPTNLAAGSTIVIWWSWLASTEAQVRDHISAATYEIRVNGNIVPNVSRIQPLVSHPTANWVATWYAAYPTPLTSGTVKITYRVTWSRQVADGVDVFGPGTNTLVEEGSCTFSVR